MKNRYSPIVDALLRKGAKVSARDARGDTPLHIALRSKNKTITEMLLRNPRDSRLLYKMNYEGETPYQIDLGNKKSILTQFCFQNYALSQINRKNLTSTHIPLVYSGLIRGISKMDDHW